VQLLQLLKLAAKVALKLDGDGVRHICDIVSELDEFLETFLEERCFVRGVFQKFRP